jgi:hypothetical protein
VPPDGRHDFDFVLGGWQIVNRRRVDPFDAAADEWVEFPATLTARPVLGGLGHVDEFVAPATAGRRAINGMALRLFDPRSGLWRDWWAADGDPGTLDPPLTGGFHDGVGRFHGDQLVAGRRTVVRYLWPHASPAGARWEQAFSLDGGTSWITNWTMDYTPLASR